MSIMGWRVHFTRREPVRPREDTALMRAFPELFSRLPEDSAERGAPEDQPFQLGPRGEYDVC
jgi:hypothetical protein